MGPYGPARRTPRRAMLDAVLSLALGLALATCGPAARDERVAEVDGQAVPMAELRREVEVRLENDPSALLADVLTEELDRLVDRAVALNRANQLGIQVSDGEVTERLQLIHGADFAGDAGYREGVRSEMRLERALVEDLAPKLVAPESALADSFERHRDQYRRPERILVRQIVVEEEGRAQKLRQQLEGGASFEALAITHSLAPEGKEGGLLPPFARGELPEVFDRTFELQAGQLSAVIESPHGYHIFLVVERLAPQEPELAEVRDELMVQLAHERLQELRPQWLRDLRRQAEITVNERLLESFEQ
jgi:parvulin-like peptidyl-prolyl isomerase